MLIPPVKFLQALKPGQTSLGIEISDSSIKMSKVLLRRKAGPLIQTFLSEPIPPQVMEEGKIKEPLRLIQTLQTMLARLDSKPKHVHLVFPSQSIMVRFLKFPDIPEKDLAKLLDFEIHHNIHLPFENPLFDFVKLNGTATKRKKAKKIKQEAPAEPAKDGFLEAAAAKEEQSAGKGLFDEFEEAQPKEEAAQCDVMLVAAPKEMVEQYLEIMKAARITLTSIEIKALSLFRLVEWTALIDTQGAFLLVDMNATAGDLSVFNGSELKITRSIPLNFADSSGEGVQLQGGTDSLFAEFLDPDADFRNQCSDFAHELERLMNFYRYTLNNRNQEFAGAVISGDYPRLHDILAYLRERLPIPVQLFQPGEAFGHNAAFQSVFPAYAVSLGLALRGNEA